MACKVIWTKRAWLTYQANIEYLEVMWTEKEIQKFVLLADKRIENLSKNPMIGTSRNKANPNVRRQTKSQLKYGIDCHQ